LSELSEKQAPQVDPEYIFQDSVTAEICSFIREIGLSLEAATISEETFLPGIAIYGGVMLVDEGKLSQPGDLLHEAGHLATTAPDRRFSAEREVGQNGGDEMMAIAWSWAALTHLRLAPEVVFHPEGYSGGSKSIIENFSNDRFFGVPMLQWLGMTADDDNADKLGVLPYPNMIKWIRDH
jgi:hypothetical protein